MVTAVVFCVSSHSAFEGRTSNLVASINAFTKTFAESEQSIIDKSLDDDEDASRMIPM